MTLSADLFWSFRSPYSYLATRRTRALSEQYDLTITPDRSFPVVR